MVWNCPLGVDAYAAAGRALAVPRPRCPSCHALLIFWPGYWRFVRHQGTSVRIWIRRSKCRACNVTHALLPAFLLRRRLDPAAVIGGAVARIVAGAGVRSVAQALGVPHTTAREWRRRHRARAPASLARAEALLVELGGELRRASSPDVERAALEALVDAWRWAARRAAGATPGLWQFVSAVSGGSWLSTTTSPPWAALSGRSFIGATSSAAREECRPCASSPRPSPCSGSP